MQTFINFTTGSTLFFAAIAILCLTTLHFVSREYHPSWRMISEYAFGKHKWLITSFFICWGLSTISISLFCFVFSLSSFAKIGALLILISGVGAIMGGLFDIKHKLHGLSFGLGVPTLPIGALIWSYHLFGNLWVNDALASNLVWCAHLTWVSVLLMAFGMIVLISGFKKAGIAVGPNMPPPEKLPEGVIAFSGYANRLLVLCYMAWPVLLALYNFV